MNEDALRTDIDKLNLTNGDFVVVKMSLVAGDVDLVGEGIRRALEARGLDECVVLLMSEGDSIEALDEAEMQQHGWVRAE